MSGIESDIVEKEIQTNQNHNHQSKSATPNVSIKMDSSNSSCPIQVNIDANHENDIRLLFSWKMEDGCRKRKKIWENDEESHQKKTQNSTNRIKVETSDLLRHNLQTKEFTDVCISFQTSIITDEKLMARFEELVNDDRVDVTSVEKNQGISPLFILIHYLSALPNVFELSKLLILKGVYVNGRGSIAIHDDWTPLHALSKNQQLSGELKLKLVKFLIQNGADVNIRDGVGRSPLYNFCCYYRNDNLGDILQLLIDSGAAINLKDKYGSTPFHVLCRNCREDNLIYLAQLIENGAEVHPEGYESPLFLLCGWQVENENLIHLVRLLIEEGADVTAGWNGRTPLHALCQNYRIKELLMDIVKVMVKGNGLKGADINAKDSKGLTPLVILRNRGFCV